jgi:pimeloyl-ACP methyl ester carboxylesterase
MARLHHELLAGDAAPRGWLLITHGIYGSGGNWRSIARKLTRARPELGCVLVDLRNHGRSAGAAAPADDAAPPPHDLAACADDVGELIDALAAGGKQVRAAAGHSFGGKVIAMLRHRRGEHAHVEDVRQWWMLDSSPSARPEAATEPGNQVREVLEAMEALPPTLPTRAAFEEALLAAGKPRALVQWLAQNLEPAGGSPSGDRDGDGGSGAGFRLRLPLPAIREMLGHYYATDLWHSLRDPEGGEVHVVVATRSSTLSPADRAALRAAPSHLKAHELDAGHWLHIEAGDAVVALLAEQVAL